MLIVTGYWLVGAGVIALSLECVGAAVVLFGLAVLLIRLA
jgi:hypothetical protein